MRIKVFLGIILLGMPLKGRAQQDTIADQRLEEVVVTAKLPLVEMSAGKTTYRMDASITQSTGNLYDVLSSLPGVMIDSKGGILLNGKSGVQVLMDGKPTYLSGEELVNLLRSTPATNADKIDLVTQPSARYEAAGSIGMIDIRTRKIKLRGMNLALNGNGTLGRSGGGGYGSASMNLRQDKFNFFLTYSYYLGNQTIDMDIDRAFNGDERMLQTSYRRRSTYLHYLRGGCDFYINPHTVWGVTLNGNLSGRTENADMRIETQGAERPETTDGHLDNDWNNFSAGTNFTHRLRRDGGEISAAFDYFSYDRSEVQHIHYSKPDTLKGDMQGRIHIYAGQADATYPLNEQWKLQGGGKSAFVKIDNDAGYLRPVPSGWQADGSLGSRFVYDENINAAYLQAGYEHRRLKFSAGLRLEHTRVHGELSGNTVQRDSSFTTNYVHLFPTCSVQYGLEHGSAFQLSYSRRIARPNYQDLNPFTYIFDDYTHEGGNTRLRPSFSDNIELAYVHHEWLQAVLFFSHTDDAIMKTYQTQEDLRIYVTPENLAAYVQTGLRIHAANLSLASWWKMHLTAIGLYNRYRWTEQGERMRNNLLTPLVSSMSQFTFTPAWSAELSANYRGRMAYGQATVHPTLEVNAGIQKKILRGKGTVSLFAKDIFGTNNERVDIRAVGTKAYVDSHGDSSQRVIGIAFSWRFQKGSEVKESRRKNGLDETKRVNL